MDIPEDQDIQLQRASSELLVDLQTSLKPFLWRDGKIRRRVRAKETDRLVALLEPFQELPQLLDPHLNNLVPVLADAFIASLHSKKSKSNTHTQLLIPLSRAICRLLYTFCKIRGEKVIVRFLSTDTRHLELLLSAIESGVRAEEEESTDTWEWEERYITLLWLSQLLLAPFDLASISSANTNTSHARISGLVWPENAPGVTHRVVPLAIKYLSSSGKERDAAKILLVRVAMRKDMQELGVLEALVKWATSGLHPSSEEKSSYHYLGILSFLAGILNSSISTADMDPYLSTIFHILQNDSPEHVTFMETINSSVVARKTILKVLRNICVIVLRHDGTDETTEMVETTIGVLLESLADPATPVRLAASKALSVITLKLPADMAAQVVEEVIALLNRNIFWNGKSQDLSGVNSAEWHGLILTLSQLLYRRSPPASSLSDILQALLAGLSFEQRSTSGSSVGTNVRDAACFGIWALARRYMTDELQIIELKSKGTSSVLQVLATELVISASLDPAGNIRRGSSAALQELIGRHPNTIDEGIQVVQVVDYHAVALRSRAMTEVAFQAAILSDYYMAGILEALLGWRGVGDADAGARRITALTYGKLTRDKGGNNRYSQVFPQLKTRLQVLKPREDDERHGIILCVASVIERLASEPSTEKPIPGLADTVAWVLNEANTAVHRRTDLIAEAVSQMILKLTASSLYNEMGEGVLDRAKQLLAKWLRRNEAEVIDSSSQAASSLFILLDEKQRENWISELLGALSENYRDGQDKGIISVLFKIFPSVSASVKVSITQGLHARWNSGHKIETRAAILRYLGESKALISQTSDFVDIIADGLDDYTTNARGDVGSLVRIEAVQTTGSIWEAIQSKPGTELDIFNRLFGKVLRLAVEKLDKVRAEAQKAVAQALRSDSKIAWLQNCPSSSEEYFKFLLGLQTDASCLLSEKFENHWSMDMFEGYVGSADTGSEDLVRSSRAALAEYCECGNTEIVCSTLMQVLKANISYDRVLVPTLEVICFLFDAHIIQHSNTNWRSLYIMVQKSHYKTGNVRKLEAAVRMYGNLVQVYPEALEKLTTMILHPFPKIRNQVADTLFMVRGVGKGVNWSQAGKDDLKRLQSTLQVE